MVESRSPALPNDSLHIAMEWQVTLWSGEVTAEEHSAFERWLHARQEHQIAWQQVQQVNRQLGEVPDQLASRVLRQAAAANLKRRRLLLNVGVMTSLGVLGFGVSRTSQWHIATADYRTARGQFQNLTLPDGTRLMLNTASAVDVQFSNEVRRLVLHRGEIQIVTGTDSTSLTGTPRPFIVETIVGTVRPIGTQFIVQQLDQRVQVQVTEGAVELRPKQGQGTRLDAGQQAFFSQQGTFPAQAADPINTAWTRGLLIAEQQTLGNFIATLSRYHSGVLRCDPAVAELMVSGVYPLNDPAAILPALAQVLPIRVNSLMGYWTSITAR